MIGSWVCARSQKLIEKVAMSYLELNSIESCHFGKRNAVSELSLGLFNIFKGHLFGGWGLLASQISDLLSAGDSRRRPGLEASGFEKICCSPCMAKLDHDLASFWMDCVSNFPPACSLCLCEEIPSSSGASTSLAPSHAFCEDESRPTPLTIVLSHQVCGHTVFCAPFSGESWHHYSVFEKKFSHLNGVWPIDSLHQYLIWGDQKIYIKVMSQCPPKAERRVNFLTIFFWLTVSLNFDRFWSGR